MYCAYDDEKNIIAFHDSKKVVERYVENVYKYNKLILDVGKVKSKNTNVLKGLDDLYLVRYGETYIQTGYYMYLQIACQGDTEDNEFARDILYRVIQTRKLSEKKIQSILKTIKVLEDIIYDDESYTPTLDYLKRLKLDYDPYLYNIGLPGCS